MRKTNLLITSLLGIIGLMAYFMSFQTINDDKMVDVEVEAGDKKLLEDVYFSGELYDYSSFYTINDETFTYESLSYLERLDTPMSTNLMLLQEQYPDFMNSVLYSGSYDYTILNSQKYVISTEFDYEDGSYMKDSRHLNMKLLDKESGKVEEEKINRDNAPEGDWHNVLSIYEDYPMVQVVFHTESWTDVGSNSTLSFGEYNIETKDYTENSLIKEDNSNFYISNNYSQVDTSQKIRLLSKYNEQTGIEQLNYLLDMEDGTLHTIENKDRLYFVSDDSKLYALEKEEDQSFLRQYDYTGAELLSEVELDAELDLNGAYNPYILELRDNKLFIVENQFNESMEQINLKPTLLAIYDSQTGAELLSGSIDYNISNEVPGVVEGSISQFGYSSDF